MPMSIVAGQVKCFLNLVHCFVQLHLLLSYSTNTFDWYCCEMDYSHSIQFQKQSMDFWKNSYWMHSCCHTKQVVYVIDISFTYRCRFDVLVTKSSCCLWHWWFFSQTLRVEPRSRAVTDWYRVRHGLAQSDSITTSLLCQLACLGVNLYSLEIPCCSAEVLRSVTAHKSCLWLFVIFCSTL